MQGVECRVQGVECRVQGVGCGVSRVRLQAGVAKYEAFRACRGVYRVTSLTRKRTPLVPYRVKLAASLLTSLEGGGCGVWGSRCKVQGCKL